MPYISNEKLKFSQARSNWFKQLCAWIIGSKGELLGYAGGLQAKKKLLKLENRGQRPEQLEMFGESNYFEKVGLLLSAY